MMTRYEEVDAIFKRCGTDKNSESHNYAKVYQDIAPDIETMLEIGLGGGQSLKAWLEIFPKAEIWGIDVNEVGDKELMADPRIHFIHANIDDFVPNELPQFDLIVDDASHDPDAMLRGWKALMPYLKGTYVIEDVNENHIFKVLAGVPNTASMIVTKHAGDNRVITWSADGYRS